MSEKISDQVYNKNFQMLLDEFHLLIKPNPSADKIKSELEQLKAKSKSKEIILTGAQREAIFARANNYLNGTYASTSREYKVHVHTK